jgi:uncharacterized protein (DUF1778 family)
VITPQAPCFSAKKFKKYRKVKKMKNRVRTERLHLRLTKEEKAFIDEKMNENKSLSYSDFLLKAVGQMQCYVIDTRPILDVAGELNRIGTNINQIAKIANVSRSIFEDDVKDLQTKITEIEDMVQEALGVLIDIKEGRMNGVHKDKTD